MEWAKQRLRLGKVFGHLNTHSICILLIVVCLPYLTLSLQVNNTSASSESSNNTGHHPTHREILHSHRSRGEDVIGNSSDAAAVTLSDSSSSSDEISKDDFAGGNHHGQLGLRKPHPKNQDGEEDCNSTDSHSGIPAHDETEFHRIQALLTDIFFDELEADEEAEEPENGLSEDQGDSLSRGNVDESHPDKSHTPISRHIRSSEDEHGVDGRAEGPRGNSKGSSKKGPHRNHNGAAAKNKSAKGGKPKGGKGSKATDLNKYNEYMDSVFRRMNTMIKSKKMDPLRVNLYAGPSKKHGGSSGGGKKNKKKNQARMNLEEEEGFDEEDFDEDDDLENGPARKDIFLNMSSHSGHLNKNESESKRKIRALLESVNETVSEFESDDSSNLDSVSESPRATSKESNKNKRPKPGNRNKEQPKNGKTKGKGGEGNASNKKPGNKGANKTVSKNKKNNKTTGSKPTRGVLHGLSTLKREGNVAVIKQGEKARIVRANFLLGPVSLEIMPRKSKASENAVAATATAPKLKGVLEVRLKKGSPTRIRKLRVYPPKNVEVDGASSSSGSASASSKGGNKPRQYGKVTPMATYRLRQIAATVVRQTDNKSLKAE